MAGTYGPHPSVVICGHKSPSGAGVNVAHEQVSIALLRFPVSQEKTSFVSASIAMNVYCSPTSGPSSIRVRRSRFADVAVKFIALNPISGEVLQLAAHEGIALFAGLKQQAHYGVPVNASETFDASDAHSFHHQFQDGLCFQTPKFKTSVFGRADSRSWG